MREGGFAGGITELATAAGFQRAGDAADVDHGAGVAFALQGGDVLTAGEEGEEGHAHKVPGGHVGAEGGFPLRRLAPQEMLADSLGVVAVGGTVGAAETGIVIASDACVIDEELDAAGFPLGKFGGEARDFRFLGDIAWEGDDSARMGAVEVNDSAERVWTAAGDVDAGSVRGESLGDHLGIHVLDREVGR